jgi:hypothetical protein
MWPRYGVWVRPGGRLEVKFYSADPSRVALEMLRLREMGLVEGVHFTAKATKSRSWCIYVRKAGLIRAAWLSVRGSGRQRELAADFVDHVLRRAREAGEKTYKKVLEIVETGASIGSLKLAGFMGEAWVGRKRYVVKAFGCSVAVGASGLLHVAVSAEVGGVVDVYVFSFGRWSSIRGFAYADAHAPGGREADAERLVALVAALTGKRPKVMRNKRGKITVMLRGEHLYRLARYAELTDAIEKWLGETSAKRGTSRRPPL